jgi:predicted dehydrogenase
MLGMPSRAELTKRRILVVGCGSIGLRHLNNLRALGMTDLSVCSAPARVARALEQVDATPFASLDQALDSGQEIVLVCNSTHLHLATARRAIEAGAHVFIEKPVSHSLAGVQELLQLAQMHTRTVMVGYNMRFHPVLQTVHDLLQAGTIGRILQARAEMGQYLPAWRPSRDYAQTYTAHRSKGGGIVLDMSHELDYMLWLFGPVVYVACLADQLSSLDVDAEDTAMMLLQFESGAFGSIHLDFVQRGYARHGKAVGDSGVIRWQFREPQVEYRTDESDQWIKIGFPAYELNEMYVDEITHFLACVEQGVEPEIGIQEGLTTLKLAAHALESARSRQFVRSEA